MARIPYAPEAKPGLNLFRMLAHSPPVLAGFTKLGGALLLEGTLDARLREIAILRVGHRAGACYEVAKHEAIARKLGMSEPDLAALRLGADASTLGDAGQAVLALADELFGAIRASDAALAAVRRHLDDRQTVELVTAIGFYGLVCRFLETLGVDEERAQ